MAKFKYRMQNIFELRKKLEEQQKMVLATARINLNNEEDKLKNLFERKQEYEDIVRNACLDKLNVADIRRSVKAYESMDYFISLQKIEVKKAEGKVAVEQDKMVNAMKDRKIQEKLRERAFDRFLKEVDYEEAAITDELVAYKYGTKEEE